MWPEDYYRELDGAMRKELLDKEIDSCGGKIPEEDRLRLELWEARYGGADAGVDYFMKGWTDLSLIAKKEPAAGGRSGFRQAARALMLERFSGERGIYTDLLYEEYIHLFHMIIYLYLHDYGFTHHVLGIGKIGADDLQKKIAERLVRVTRELPARYNMTNLFEPLESAAAEAFAESFDGRPQL